VKIKVHKGEQPKQQQHTHTSQHAINNTPRRNREEGGEMQHRLMPDQNKASKKRKEKGK
jgi:hypothetical protein